MKAFKTKLRYSGVILGGVPIESMDKDKLRKALHKVSRKFLIESIIQTTEAINRLWDIYDLREQDAEANK